MRQATVHSKRRRVEVEMQPTPINPWSWSGKLGFDNLESVLAAADMTLANIVRLNVYTTYVDELFRHWASLVHRFGDSDGGWATSVVGVTRFAAPQLLVLLEVTAVD
jgi:enamine deaminase RidA (YjgF/YER057c/UK114 family)